MKRLFSLILVVLVLCTVIPVTALSTIAAAPTSGDCTGFGGEVSWKLENGDTLRISGHGLIKDYASASYQPWSSYYEDIKHIIVEDGITRIGNYAFAKLYYVETISLGKDVFTIGAYAFYQTTYYTKKDVNLIIPAMTYDIEEGAFYQAIYLRNVYIQTDYDAFPQYVRDDWGYKGLSIGKYAFFKCEKLRSVAIGDLKKNTLKTVIIDEEAFEKCYELENIYMSGSAWTIYYAAFYKCEKLKKIYYYGEEGSFSTQNVTSSYNDPFLNAVQNIQYRNVVDEPWRENNTEHWRTIDGIDAFRFDEELHTFVNTPDKKYAVASDSLYFRPHCEVCGKTGQGTIFAFDMPSAIHLTKEITVLQSGWYVVDSEIDYGGARLEIAGDVKLYLKDGCGIKTSGGIHVSGGNTLRVYSESINYEDPSKMGYIKATSAPKECAGIGGNAWDGNPGKTIIYGGYIEARSYDEGAGIGGGYQGNAEVEIFDGYIRANGTYGSAGIGSAFRGDCTVTIHGGKIIARGDGAHNCDGVGCGYYANVNIKIYESARANIDGSISGNVQYLSGSVLSDGNLWIVLIVGILAVGGIVAAIVVLKKKKKPALAGAVSEKADSNDDE